MANFGCSEEHGEGYQEGKGGHNHVLASIEEVEAHFVAEVVDDLVAHGCELLDFSKFQEFI